MKNKFVVIITSLLFSFSSFALAASANSEQVELWLTKMHHAAHMLNYKGVFVYGQKDNLSSMQIVHSQDEFGERERLLSLDGTGREVIRTKDSVICILPDSKSVMVEKSRPKSSFPPAFPVKIAEMEANYDFYLSGKDMVAGQITQKIVINPKDKYRYGHMLWIDEKTGLLLKTHLIGERGQVVEKFMFTQIDYMEKVPEALLKASVLGENYIWYESGKAKKHESQKLSKWAVKNLPKGFKPDMSRKHVMPRSGIAMEQLMYTDGLTSVSVFIEKHSEDEDLLNGSSHMGAINACGRDLDSGVHITVIGEVPHAAVKMICDSVYLK